MEKQKMIPDELLMIEIIDKQHTPIHNTKPISLRTTKKTLKSTTQMNPTTCPTKKTSQIKIKYYCSELQITISVSIGDLSKHSTFLFQKKLNNKIQPVFKNIMDISVDKTVVTQNSPTKMNNV